MKALYLLLHIFTVSFPLSRSFEPRIQYAKKWKSLFPAIAITATFFLIWDVVFTAEGVWGFNEKYTLGIRIFSLPVEEWLFFITVPFASVFIYECVVYFLPGIASGRAVRLVTALLAIALILLALLHQGKAYTFWNFTFCGSFLLLAALRNPAWLGKFWVAYFIHLIPFLLVNGILTGSFLDEPIVWYNDSENLAIRILTIPVEDTIYALLLLVMNITFFEGLNNYFKVRT